MINEELKLFLVTFCQPCHVAGGVLFYQCDAGHVFMDVPRYLDSLPGYEGVERGEQGILVLMIGVSHKGVGLELWSELSDTIAETTLSFVNSTVPAIEEWLKSVCLPASKW